VRPSEAAAPTKPGEYKSQDDRDEVLERRYQFEHEGFPSTLAFVSANADVLAQQFFEWRQRHGVSGTLAEALVVFEAARFGVALYPAPHGVLWFAVRCHLAPREGGRVAPRSGPVVAPTNHARRILAERMAMPEHRMSEAEYEQRQAELLEQRSRVVGKEG
jgi:hypothetical protein